MTWAVRLQRTLCHCEEGAERATRQSIVSRGKRDGCCLFAYWSQWIATGFRPRDDKGGGRMPSVTTHTLSLRGGSEVSDAAIHRVSRGCVAAASAVLFRLLGHGGSARAAPPPLGPTDSFLAPLLLLLETNTEADAVRTVAGGVSVAPSRTQGRPAVRQEPPRRTRCEPEAGPLGSTTGLPVG